jgi:spore coat polysaccharide biosynthesis predicted glycosyltransferase SpsG
MAAGKSWAIRLAAGPGIGWGHVVRCVALAELAIEAGAKKPYLIGPPDVRAEQIASAAGLSWVSVDGPEAELAALYDCSISGGWLVIDDYTMALASAARLKASLNCRILAFDDHRTWDDPVIDAVVAVSVAAEQWSYGHCRAFTGPRYLPLRTAVRCIAPNPVRKGCLVALGGAAQVEQVRACAVAAVAQSPVKVAASAGISTAAMAGALRGVDGAEMLPLVPDLAAQLSKATVCICSGGLAKYEALALGCLPVVVGGNSVEIADTTLLARRGLAVITDVGCLAETLATYCTFEWLAEFRLRSAAIRVGADARILARIIGD